MRRHDACIRWSALSSKVQLTLEAKEVVRRLKAMRRKDLLRVKEEPDVAAIRKPHAEGRLSAERFARASPELAEGGEKFAYEIARPAHGT